MILLKPIYFYMFLSTLFIGICIYLFGTSKLRFSSAPQHNSSDPITIRQPSLPPTSFIPSQSDLSYTTDAGAPNTKLTLQYPVIYTKSYNNAINLCDSKQNNLCLYYPKDSFPDSNFGGASLSVWLPQRCLILNNPIDKKIGNFVYSAAKIQDGDLDSQNLNFIYQYQGPEVTCLQATMQIYHGNLSSSQIDQIKSDFEKVLSTLNFTSVSPTLSPSLQLLKSQLEEPTTWKPSKEHLSYTFCDGYQPDQITKYMKSLASKEIYWYEKVVGNYSYIPTHLSGDIVRQGADVFYTPNTLNLDNLDLSGFSHCFSGAGEALPFVATKDKIYWRPNVCIGGVAPDDPVDNKNLNEYNQKCEQTYKDIALIYSGNMNPVGK